MSWFSEMIHPGRSYDKAQAAKDAYYNASQGTRQPYIDRGERGGNALEEFMNNLKNPGKLQDEWSKGYTQSDYAKQLQAQNQTSGLDAASAMGLGGSSGALTNIQKGAGDIVQKDRQQYMDDMMKKYMAAMGIGGSLYGTGASFGKDQATGQENQGEWSANNAFNKNQAGSNILSKIGPQAFEMIMQMLGGGGFPGFGGMTSDMYGGS